MDPDLLSLDEVLLRCQELGLEVSERTFRYYSVLGLLPSPVKRPSGDARVHFYQVDILDRLQQIRTLQAQGHSLKQVKKLLVEAPSEAPSPSFVRAVAEGRWQETCQRFLDSSGESEAVRRFFYELLSLQGLSLEAVSARDREACCGQLAQWHQRQAKGARAGTGFHHRLLAAGPERAKSLDSLLQRVEALPTEGLPLAQRAQSRLAATLRQLSGGQPGEGAKCDQALADLENFLSGYCALLETDLGQIPVPSECGIVRTSS